MTLKFLAFICFQELHLHGNSIGDEEARALMSSLSSNKGLNLLFLLVIGHICRASFSALLLQCF